MIELKMVNLIELGAAENVDKFKVKEISQLEAGKAIDGGNSH